MRPLLQLLRLQLTLRMLGFHIGNHRLLPGKRCPYEEDVSVPLLIRGPDVPQGVNTTITNSHTDMAPTILQMLGVPLRDDFDGAPMAYTQDALSNSIKNEIVQVEFWGGGIGPLGLNAKTYYNNTYKALRMLSDDYNLYYSTWCTGEHEFYDSTFLESRPPLRHEDDDYDRMSERYMGYMLTLEQ